MCGDDKFRKEIINDALTISKSSSLIIDKLTKENAELRRISNSALDINDRLLKISTQLAIELQKEKNSKTFTNGEKVKIKNNCKGRALYLGILNNHLNRKFKFIEPVFSDNPYKNCMISLLDNNYIYYIDIDILEKE